MPHPAQAIKIAILAMGGEGGGVLADWIVDLGEHNGYIAQTTSVPGVAQRTGATIYYLELFPAAAAEAAGAAPVLALMPLPGDVDLVLVSELMEAGRAVQRGLVTPDRSTLICSTHRVYAIAEKMAMGDGRADAELLLAQAAAAAQRFVGFDMAALAEQTGSLISAVLFGALAGSGVLPFSRAQFEATIERGGVGVTPSLKAFAAGWTQAQAAPPKANEPSLATPVTRARHPQVQALLERAGVRWRGETLRLVTEGLRRSLDYQDSAYAAQYLQRLEQLADALPQATPGIDTLMAEAARHLALWMSYEDTFRVADLKTRDSRFARVRGEVRAQAQQLLTINEYLHPRLQEIAESMPAPLGRWLLASGTPRRWIERLAASGRVVQTSSLRGYLLLSGVAALRRWRRATLRHALETERIEAWLAEVRHCAARDVALATEILRCQRLVKGYGDTHERGLHSYARLLALRRSAGTRMTAGLLAELRQAALQDEHGKALQAALQRHGLD